MMAELTAPETLQTNNYNQDNGQHPADINVTYDTPLSQAFSNLSYIEFTSLF